ncbi:hypothetical protein HU200_054462 [Digitaria exilis]|uniref:F-box domain-containing protein n=1 Tax=Digitaria exilis TaxID=1010633 RepID=A0A835AL86_9POAL|nr:hypothetical protein HU200_054462 [Digitaria exilis]CAB3490948.1 unnamed protein product [Digitaria exilis]
MAAAAAAGVGAGLGATDAFAGAAAARTTAIDDVPADVMALVLRCLDGASLAAVGCVCSNLRRLAADPATWRELCLAMWPSLNDIPSSSYYTIAGGVHYRALFADAFPFPATFSTPPPPPAASSSSSPAGCNHPLLPERLVSAVDLHHGGALIMSRIVETDATSDWFLGSPFRVDALVQEAFSSPTPAIAAADLSLSWILIDPSTGRALNASSRRPVAVDRKWLTGDTVARFAVVLAGVALEAAVTCDERRGHVREVSLCVEDGDGGGVSGRDGLVAVAAAMAGARCGGGRGAEAAARVRYEEFVAGKKARKEWKARREGMVDLCCSGVGAAAFVGFLVMLTLR